MIFLILIVLEGNHVCTGVQDQAVLAMGRLIDADDAHVALEAERFEGRLNDKDGLV